ncbi:hypothetical protein FSP39_019711 [Pinctada imbricata]|uniref:Transmembrane protein n=1 Tax=Pinctada imbricata TaxID=66713 RepID=A0AA88Y5E4_PINIB|nr:hypothetical protein FSP39_019711 [Pinctada imbricata]
MLADQSLPPHVVSGLRALGNLLKPPENHAPFHKPRVSPLVSVTESTNYGSDSEESPYTGERPSTLPKKIRRSLPPSLLRRMSTSTWTTTTSATGMPTLELEPCRIRSSSFRHSRDGTPGSSPVGSRSNSPSPSSPTTVLTIPKSRSFSLANPTPMVSNHAKRQMRKSMATSSFAGTESGVSCRVDSHFKHISPLARDDNDSADEGDRLRGREQQFKRLNMTSDYESNDSPSSSDHSDNVMTSDDLLITGSPPKKSHISRGNSSLHSSSQKQRVASLVVILAVKRVNVSVASLVTMVAVTLVVIVAVQRVNVSVASFVTMVDVTFVTMAAITLIVIVAVQRVNVSVASFVTMVAVTFVTMAAVSLVVIVAVQRVNVSVASFVTMVDVTFVTMAAVTLVVIVAVQRVNVSVASFVTMVAITNLGRAGQVFVYDKRTMSFDRFELTRSTTKQIFVMN